MNSCRVFVILPVQGAHAVGGAVGKGLVQEGNFLVEAAVRLQLKAGFSIIHVSCACLHAAMCF